VAKLYSFSIPLDGDLVDAYCVLQKGFTDQFVYYRKDVPYRFMGLGRCIALSSTHETEFVLQGSAPIPTAMFSFNRFDVANPKPADEMMQAFPRLRFMIPEVVLIENEQGRFLQVNSLGPVYKGRVERFLRHAQEAPHRTRRTIECRVFPDRYEAWTEEMDQTLEAIASGRVKKLVPSRRQAIAATAPFSSKDVLLNLIDGRPG
jgi:menaquinone-specific isochorismate synthase